MRDTRTGAARKGTPKGAAVDRTGKGGMPTPRGGSSSAPKPAPKGQPIAPRGTSTKTPAAKAKAERAQAELREKEKRQKAVEVRRAERKASPTDTKRQEILAARNERLKRLEEEARKEAARKKERRQKAAEVRRAERKASPTDTKLAGRYRNLAGQ